MKHFSRLFLLTVTFVFAFSSIYATSTLTAKTQTDGQKTVSTVNTTNPISNERAVTSRDDIFFDDMESYDVGSFLAESDVSGYWTTWSNNPGSAEDGIITDLQAASPVKSCLIEGTNDQVLLLGNKTSGSYVVSVDYYVPSGFGGYINLQHFEVPGTEWACEVYFGAAEGADNGYMYAGDPTEIPFTFPHDAWFTIEFVIELDSDLAACSIDNNFVAEWQFSLQAQGEAGTLQLGGVNLYAGAPTGDVATYYFDNVDYVNNSGPVVLFYDDMESYTLGTYLAESDETGFWTTWSNDPGSAEDALITDAESASPTQSCIVDGSTDLVLKLGNKTSGEFQVNVEYFIPSGFGGYINLQHFEAPGTEWACEAYFGAIDGDDNGYMYAGDPAEIPFTFPHDTWFDIVFNIDLDNDLAECLIDGIVVAEWQFSLQAQGDPGTLQLGGVNLYAGAPTGDVATYYFDNIEFVQVNAGSSDPIIDVDPTSFVVFLDEGQTTNEMFTITNTGGGELDYQIVTTYPQDSKALTTEPAGANTPKMLNQVISADPNYTPSANQPASRDELLHYDGDNGSAIGNNDNPYEWRVSAMFPSDMVQPYIGMEINEIHVFINDPGIAYKAQIYGMGSYNTPGPGELLLEQDFTAPGGDWVIISLDTPVKIDGSDIWVGYWVSSTAGSFTPGTDAGPADPNGDWISFGPGWSHLTGSGLDYNWNIRANLTGTPITQWLSAAPTSGLLAADEYDDIDVTIDASGLTEAGYTGKFLIRNNDQTNELVSVIVNLVVVVGVDENGENEYVAVYPNPASTLLRLESNGEINNIRLVNTIGQVVYNSSANVTNTQIDISNFDNGVYFIQIDTKNGTTTQKILIQ